MQALHVIVIVENDIILPLASTALELLLTCGLAFAATGNGSHKADTIKGGSSALPRNGSPSTTN